MFVILLNHIIMYVSTNRGGISNRIKSLVSCIKLADENNTDYKVKWDIIEKYRKKGTPHILNCSFDKLFSNDLNQIVHILEDMKNHC